MSISKNITDKEINKLCKQKPIYEETYKAGVIVIDKRQVVDMIKQGEAIIEAKKHADLGNGIEAFAIRIICNKKK